MSSDLPAEEYPHADDVEPGLMFFFVPAQHEYPHLTGFNASPIEYVVWDKTVPWTVVTKERVGVYTPQLWKYCLLGPGPTLRWYHGHLGWIRRVADHSTSVVQ